LIHAETVQVLLLLRLVTPEFTSTVVPLPLRTKAPMPAPGPAVVLIEPEPPLRLKVPFIAGPPERSLMTVLPKRWLKLKLKVSAVFQIYGNVGLVSANTVLTGFPVPTCICWVDLCRPRSKAEISSAQQFCPYGKALCRAPNNDQLHWQPGSYPGMLAARRSLAQT
jgi:hypothetical protein